jgi:hypothetical protein
MKDIEDTLRWAQELAEGLPDRYREAAFAELLSYALSTSGTTRHDVTQHASEKSESSTPLRAPWQQKLIDNLPSAHLVASKGSRDQQAIWAIIKLLDADEEATPASVRDQIEAGLGINAESSDNTSRRLRQLTPTFAMRQKRQDGRGYAYTPTTYALELFEGLVE